MTKSKIYTEFFYTVEYDESEHALIVLLYKLSLVAGLTECTIEQRWNIKIPSFLHWFFSSKTMYNAVLFEFQNIMCKLKNTEYEIYCEPDAYEQLKRAAIKYNTTSSNPIVAFNYMQFNIRNYTRRIPATKQAILSELMRSYVTQAQESTQGMLSYLFKKVKKDSGGNYVLPTSTAEKWLERSTKPLNKFTPDELRSSWIEAEKYICLLNCHDYKV